MENLWIFLENLWQIYTLSREGGRGEGGREGRREEGGGAKEGGRVLMPMEAGQPFSSEKCQDVDEQWRVQIADWRHQLGISSK